MTRDRFLRTALCDLLDIRYPILQAGMAHVASGELAAAVSQAGGLGVIAAAGLTGAELEAEIRQVRAHGNLAFGVDLILPAGTPEALPEGAAAEALRNAPPVVAELRAELGLAPGAIQPRPIVTGELINEQIAVIFDQRVPVMVSGLGNPAPYVERAHQQGMRVLALVGNTRQARRVAAGGVDAVIAQGHEGGGHTGTVATFVLTPQVVDAVAPTPVVTAGGVGDGRGLLAALVLGATGVWVGTRFIASYEAHAHANWKSRIVDAASEDTTVTTMLTGKPNRSIRNRLIDRLESSSQPPLPMPWQGYLIDDIVGAARERGITDLTRLGSGQVVALIRDVRPAGEIVAALVAEARAIVERQRQLGWLDLDNETGNRGA